MKLCKLSIFRNILTGIILSFFSASALGSTDSCQVKDDEGKTVPFACGMLGEKRIGVTYSVLSGPSQGTFLGAEILIERSIFLGFKQLQSESEKKLASVTDNQGMGRTKKVRYETASRIEFGFLPWQGNFFMAGALTLAKDSMIIPGFDFSGDSVLRSSVKWGEASIGMKTIGSSGFGMDFGIGKAMVLSSSSKSTAPENVTIGYQKTWEQTTLENSAYAKNRVQGASLFSAFLGIHLLF